MQTNLRQTYHFVLQTARGLHFVGLALFLGPIASNILIDQYALTHGLPMLASARILVSLTSHFLVLPGLALMVGSGALMAALRDGVRLPAWLCGKVVCVALIAANSSLFLLPAIHEATRWAAIAAEHNRQFPEFFAWLAKEDRFGMANLLFFVTAGVLALGRLMQHQNEKGLSE
jgi:hypothetical protein